MTVVDIAPFFAALVAGAACGRWIPGRWAWIVGLVLPVAHFLLSVATGRASEGFATYVVPVNVALLALAALGVLAGRSLRQRAHGTLR